MRKYKFIEQKKFNGIILNRIQAIIDFGYVKTGDIGGWIEKEKNLNHNGDAWVFGNAHVYGDAWVYGDAQVYGNAQVSGNARVYGDAQVYGNAQVSGDARVYFGNLSITLKTFK